MTLMYDPENGRGGFVQGGEKLSDLFGMVLSFGVGILLSIGSP